MSNESTGLPEAQQPTGPTQLDLEKALRAELVKQQDIVYAIVGGLASAIVSAMLWAFLTVSTEYQIGYMAIGVGLLVGITVRFFGEGIEPQFGIVGAFFALFGCVLGNLLSQMGFIAQHEGISYFETLSFLNVDFIIEIYKTTFAPMDVLFYAIAAYEGFRIGAKKIEEEVVKAVAAGKVVRSPLASFRLQVVIGLVIAIAAVAFVVSRGSSAVRNFTYESGAKRSSGVTSAGREHGVWEYWWENGSQQAKGGFINGKYDGEWIFYNEDGVMTRKSTYKNGNQDGEQADYYEDGTISAQGKYVNGRQSGLWMYYFESGKVSSKGSFVLDREDGDWETYYENGQLSSKGSYAEGIQAGIWTEWYEDGKKSGEFEYTNGKVKYLNTWNEDGKPLIANGNGELKVTDFDGTLIESGMMKNGFRDGVWNRFFANGKKKEEGEYRDNVYHLKTSWTEDGIKRVQNGGGLMETFYPDGTKYESGYYKDGRRDGEWTVGFMGSDSVMIRTVYVSGKLNGQQTTYAEEGYVQIQGSFVDDERDGEWKWFSDEDELESVVTYANGKKEGSQVFYNTYGDLLRTEVYQGGKLIETTVN